MSTTVSRGSANGRVRTESRIVGYSLYDRPVAPGPPENNVLPLNTSPRAGTENTPQRGTSWPGCVRSPAASARRRHDAVGRPETFRQAFDARDLAGTAVLVGVPDPTMTLEIPLVEVFGHGGAVKRRC